jgi:hypothetical protein
MHLLERLFMPLFLFDGGEGGGGGAEEPEPKKEPEKKPAEEPEPKKEPEKKPPWGEDENFDAERAWNKLQAQEADKAKIKERAEKAEAELKKRDDATKSDQEKLEERVGGAEKERDEAKADAARLRVALKKGLTETQARRLVGETEEELEKDADELLESFKDEEGAGGEAPRTPRERMRPGAAPSSEPEESDPKKLAGQVPRV